MNWYKKAQYETMTQAQLETQIKELMREYSRLFNKKSTEIISAEEEHEMENLRLRAIYLDQILKNNIAQNREKSQQLISENKPHEVLPLNFMDYHYKGFISNDSYKRYKTKEGVSWLGGKEKYPILVKKKRYGDEFIEFRKKNEKLRYTQKIDEDDMYSDFLRDKSGDLVYMTDDQLKEKGLPLYDTGIVAFNEAGEPIGFASDEFGTDGIWVVEEYQKRGIGTDLLSEFRKQFEGDRKIGQMTSLGRKMTQKYHKKLVQEAIEKGGYVPREILEYYELV